MSEFVDTRKGFLTPEQERQADDLKEWSNKIVEMGDGIAIKYGDNLGLEKLKEPLIEKFGSDVLPTIYEIVDAVFAMLPVKED